MSVLRRYGAGAAEHARLAGERGLLERLGLRDGDFDQRHLIVEDTPAAC